jgi:uncharacterized protein
MVRLVLALAVAVAILLAVGNDFAAAERRALVIGVDRYQNLAATAQLRTAVSDAESVGRVLGGLGFSVEVARNPTLDSLIEKLTALAAKTKPGDTVFFFFSGHGVAIDGGNLLLPGDVPKITGFGAAAKERLRRSAFAESDILARIRDRLTEKTTGQIKGLIILVLDACRDNPFNQVANGRTRSLGRSRGLLVSPRPAVGVFSIYSAGADQQALDRLSDRDPSPNSVFTRVFIRHLAEPGVHLGDVIEEVRAEVAKLARTVTDPETGLPHVQTPAYYNQTLGGKVFLAGRATEEVSPAPDRCAGAEAHFRNARAIGTIAAYRDHIARFPTCAYVGLARERIAAAERIASLAPAPGRPAADVNRGPSFNCLTDRGEVEQVICHSARLSALDRTLAALYLRKFEALSSDARTALRDDQRAWLAARNGCRQAADQERCVARAYAIRIAALGGQPTSSARPAVAPVLRPPSFDCATNRRPVEQAICGDAVLAAQDRQLADAYAHLRSRLSRRARRKLQRSQRRWLAVRDRCGTTACIAEVYRRRLQELAAGAGR